jgi:hypothetical protein
MRHTNATSWSLESDPRPLPFRTSSLHIYIGNCRRQVAGRYHGPAVKFAKTLARRGLAGRQASRVVA